MAVQNSFRRTSVRVVEKSKKNVHKLLAFLQPCKWVNKFGCYIVHKPQQWANTREGSFVISVQVQISKFFHNGLYSRLHFDSNLNDSSSKLISEER